MITVKNCEICGNSNFKLFIKSRDYSVSKEDFNIQECKNCRFLFTSPRPEEKNLNKYYVSDHYISHTDGNKSLFEKTYQIVKKISINKKFRFISSYIKKGSILDIGCGTGNLLYKFKSSGWQTKGVEPSKIARQKAIKNYNLDINDSSNLSNIKEKFDIITMWHVLEHMPNLNDVLKNFNRLLNDNGKIIIAVPNPESYDAKHYKKYWAAYDLPIHFSHFTKNSISSLFEKHNFKLIKNKGMIFDSFYVSMLSEEFKGGSKNIIKATIIGLISNLIGKLTNKGFSSNLYVFKKNQKIS